MFVDPSAQLLLALGVFHLVEGVYWIRADAFIFSPRGRRHRVHQSLPFLSRGQWSLVPLSPIPWARPVFVVDTVPFVRDGSRVAARPEDDLGARSGTTPAELDWRGYAAVSRDGKDVVLDGAPFVRASSPAQARHLAAGLRARDRVGARTKAQFDRAEAQKRLESFRARTRSLQILAPLQLILLFVSAYAILFVPAGFEFWPWILCTLGLFFVATVFEFHRAHRHLYPELQSHRRLQLALMLFSPLAAARARTWLARDVFAGFHPIVVADLLLPRDAFERFARRALQAVRHPLGDDVAELASFRSSVARGLETYLADTGIDVRPDSAPQPEDHTMRAYCPRCLAQFGASSADSQECEDCPGVRRMPLLAVSAEPR